MPMTPLPAAPDRAAPLTFATRGNNLVAALAGFVTEANALETNVNAKEASAAGSAGAAAGSAGAASGSAGAAAGSAAAASGSAGAAAGSAGAASGSATAAAASRLAIDRRLYPTPSATDPTTREDGTASQVGDQYYNNSSNRFRVVSAIGPLVWSDSTAEAIAAAAAANVSKLATDQALIDTTAQKTLATTAKTASEAARDLSQTYAAASATGAKFYATDVLGRAAVADGATFGVVSGGTIAGSTITRPTIVRRDTSSTQTVLYAVVPGTEFDTKVIDNRSLAAGDTYSTPPSVLAETVATTSPNLVPNASGSANLKGASLQVGHPATIAGVVRSFSAKFSTALAGRKVEFYILSPSGGSWMCNYASGLQDGSLTGVNTFNVPVPGNLRIGVGDIVGAYTDAAAHSDGFFLATSGGLTIGPSLENAAAARISVNGVITSGAGGYSTLNARYWAIAATTAQEALLVPTRWANLPNGYPRLDSSGRVTPDQASSMLSDNTARSAAVGVVSTVYDPALGASKIVSKADTAISSLATVSLAGVSFVATYPQNLLVVGWLNGSPGFTKAGLLTKVRFPPGGTRGGGAKIQAWVVRPTAALGAVGSTATFTKVATIGEIDATDTTKHCEFAGLTIPVLAGDLIAFRGISAGLRYSDGSSEQTNYYFIAPTVADTTLAALDAGLSAVVVNSRKFDLYAEVSPGPFITAESAPNSPVRLDSAGQLPPQVVRAADAPWASLKIAAVGTSITAGGNATGNNGYIARLAAMLQCQVVNNGVGSSGIVWDGTRALSLGATQAQLTAAGFSSAQSYEVKVLGQAADLFIFDHGYNDRGLTIGTITDTTAATFYGAYNKVIGALLAERPSQRFMLITPHSVYSPTNEGYHATTENIRQAMLAIATKYQCPILDWTYSMQLSAGQASTFLLDTVHPNDTWHAMAARVLYGFILRNC